MDLVKKLNELAKEYEKEITSVYRDYAETFRKTFNERGRKDYDIKAEYVFKCLKKYYKRLEDK